MTDAPPYKRVITILLTWVDSRADFLVTRDQVSVVVKEVFNSVILKVSLGSQNSRMKAASLKTLAHWLKVWSWSDTLVLIYYDGHGRFDQKKGKMYLEPQSVSIHTCTMFKTNLW